MQGGRGLAMAEASGPGGQAASRAGTRIIYYIIV